MLSFTRHIEQLLLKNNCVIIPDLGSFITHYIPAKIIAEDDVMLPPCRIIAFNPQLRINDGNLTTAIMNSHNVSYDEAANYVDSSVWNIKQQLRSQGTFDLSSLGTLYLDVNGACRFKPSELPLPTPNLYALENIPVNNIDTSDNVDISSIQRRATKRKDILNAYNDKYVFSINKDIANYVAAAVVALVCFFTWNISSADSQHLSQTASVVSIQNVCQSSLQTEEKNFESETSSDVKNMSDIASANAAVESAKRYTIVLASAISNRNAEDFVVQLKEIGIEAKIIRANGMAQVICGSYATTAEAQTAANKLRSLPQTRDCWVKLVNS